MTEKIRVIFVCTGNICRSPMAEAIFKHMVEEAGLSDRFEISSAGLVSYHIGERPHRGTIKVLSEMQVPLDPQKTARQVNMQDIGSYDYVIALDTSHYQALKGVGNVHLMLDYSRKTTLQDVPDPYYTLDFNEVYDLLDDACRGLLTVIRKDQNQ